MDAPVLLTKGDTYALVNIIACRPVVMSPDAWDKLKAAGVIDEHGIPSPAKAQKYLMEQMAQSE